MEIKTYFNLYFLVNFSMILCYIPLKKYFLDSDYLNEEQDYGLSREVTVILISFLIVVFKMNKFSTPEQFFSSFFLITKVCVCILLFKGNNYKIFAYYLAFWFFSWILIKPSGYRGKSKFLKVNPDQLE